MSDNDPKIVNEISEILDQILMTPDDKAIWLGQKNDGLGGKSPNELIEAGEAQKVRDLLEDISTGSFL